MTEHSKSTKQRILDAACLLFAKHGYSSVTTRMVAEKVGVRHGTVNYHFKSKKALYTEVFKSVYDLDQMLSYDILLEREPIILETPSGKAYAIQRVVTDFFHRHLKVTERWKRQLILRELFDNSPVFTQLFDEVIKKESEKMLEFYYLLDPEGSKVDAFLWAHFPDAQMLNYMVGESFLKLGYDQEFIEELEQKLIRITARAMISILDLPIPEMLK